MPSTRKSTVNLETLNRVELLAVAKAEAEAVKVWEAKPKSRRAKNAPATPATDLIAARQAARANGEAVGHPGAQTVTDADLPGVVREAILATGRPSQNAVLTHLRATGRGTYPKRVARVFPSVVEALRSEGKLPEGTTVGKAHRVSDEDLPGAIEAAILATGRATHNAVVSYLRANGQGTYPKRVAAVLPDVLASMKAAGILPIRQAKGLAEQIDAELDKPANKAAIKAAAKRASARKAPAKAKAPAKSARKAPARKAR